jgi:hypothetical protein
MLTRLGSQGAGWEGYKEGGKEREGGRDLGRFWKGRVEEEGNAKRDEVMRLSN